MTKDEEIDKLKETIAAVREKREQAECSLEAWHSQFGTSQLSHAIAERDSLRQQLLQAEAAIAEVKRGTLTQKNWEILKTIDLSALDKHVAEVRKPLVDALREARIIVNLWERGPSKRVTKLIDDALAKVKEC
jgi:DNA phosphorothioation-dependent restriction protein DptG